MGGALGLALAYGALRALVAMAPTGLALRIGCLTALQRIFRRHPDVQICRSADRRRHAPCIKVLEGLEAVRLRPAMYWRPHSQPKPGTASRPQYAGGRASGAGAGSSGRRRPHDPNFPGHASCTQDSSGPSKSGSLPFRFRNTRAVSVSATFASGTAAPVGSLTVPPTWRNSITRTLSPVVCPGSCPAASR